MENEELLEKEFKVADIIKAAERVISTIGFNEAVSVITAALVAELVGIEGNETHGIRIVN